MNIALLAVFVIDALLFLFGLFMLYRNEWVFTQRTEISSQEYYRLVSHDKMLYKFWIWDVEKFKKERIDR